MNTNKLTKLIAVGLLLGLSTAGAWAADQTDQNRDDTRRTEQVDRRATQDRVHDQDASELRAEIAAPVSGDFGVGARASAGYQQDVGGYSGNGFLDANGMPSSTPTDPASMPSGATGGY